MGKKEALIAQPVLDRIGANFRRVRGETTQAAMAAATGFGQSTLSRIEAGSYPALDINALVRFALGAGVGIADLLDGVDMAMSIVRYEQTVAAAA